MAITLSSGLRSNLFALNGVQNDIQSANVRLSTGKRINSALDGAYNFFQSEGLKSRATAMKVVQDNIGQSLKVIESANKGVSGIKTLLESTAGQLRNALASAGQNTKVTTNFSYNGTGDTIGTAVSATVPGVANRLDTGDVITLSLSQDGTAATYTFNGGSTVQQVIEQINNTTTAAALNDTAAAAGNGKPRVRAYLSEGSRGNLVIEAVNSKDTGAQPLVRLTQTTLSATAGASAQSLSDVFSLTGATGVAPSQSTTALNAAAGFFEVAGGSTSATRKTIADTFKSTLDQVEQLARDAGYNGVNLLSNDTLRVGFNVEDTTSLRVEGTLVNRGNLSLGAERTADGTTLTGPGFNDAVGGRFQSDAEIKSALRSIERGLQAVNNLSASFSNNVNVVRTRQDFTKGLISTLNEGADELVQADINEEGANLLTLQTRQQLAVQALSLSSQSEQAVLRLF